MTVANLHPQLAAVARKDFAIHQECRGRVIGPSTAQRPPYTSPPRRPTWKTVPLLRTDVNTGTRFAPDRPTVSDPVSRAGVDAMIWLHDLARNHGHELLLADNMQPIIDDFINRTVRYSVLGITLIIVLDGRRVGGKGTVDTGRANVRGDAQDRVCEYLIRRDNPDQLDDDESGATIDDRTVAAAVSVDDEMITAVVRAMRRLGVAVVKAPYEADAQLAALDALDLVQYVMSEDGDLIVYGCRRVLTKVQPNGLCVLYVHEDLSKITDQTLKHCPLPKLIRKWGPGILRWYAMLAGCDYCKLEGWGPERAMKALSKVTKTSGLVVEELPMERVLTAMRTVAGAAVPDDAAARIAAGLAVYERQVPTQPTQATHQALAPRQASRLI